MTNHTMMIALLGLAVLNIVYLFMIFSLYNWGTENYNKVLDLKKILNKIAIKGSGSSAYTSDFTEFVNSNVRKALDKVD
jgi:hypothetical protein